MKDVKRFYRQLTNFLNLKKEDREELVNWYDNLSESTSIDTSLFSDVEGRAKTRLLRSVRQDRMRGRVRVLWRWSAAAVAVLTLGYFGLNYFTQVEVASNSLLASVGPAQSRAIIVLENGEEIDVDRLETNQRVQVGESMVTKDAQGQIRYVDMASGKEKIQSNSLRIPKAATYQLTLTDGTRVMLNSDSKLTYPSSFGTGDRVVHLEGEAYFEVSKTTNKSRFIVESKEQRVAVLGTKFNVKSYPKDVEAQTTLAEGSVLVNGKNEAGRNALLKPAQQSILSVGGIVVNTVNVDDVLSWVQGQFCFDGTNTLAVLEEIARWYDIDITYTRKRNAVQYKGKIPRNLSLDRLIELLNYAELQTKAIIDGNKRINLIIT